MFRNQYGITVYATFHYEPTYADTIIASLQHLWSNMGLCHDNNWYLYRIFSHEPFHEANDKIELQLHLV